MQQIILGKPEDMTRNPPTKNDKGEYVGGAAIERTGVKGVKGTRQPVLLSEAFRMDTCPKSILYQNGHFATGQIAKMTCCLRRVCQ